MEGPGSGVRAAALSGGPGRGNMGALATRSLSGQTQRRGGGHRHCGIPVLARTRRRRDLSQYSEALFATSTCIQRHTEIASRVSEGVSLYWDAFFTLRFVCD
ncbi:hypothetical protein E2C01_059374 [Portunus trituberculatus]|uniref:Uncharacterized protein n=1 Tax=Portunus trituberculatus TaxID=210409 RepID=A0A5B7GY02_PORTR|nr:hypothetical protein [Portunus trituberculatus]